MAKERLDTLLVKRGIAQSREKAKAIIMAGEILVDGQREDKAGSMFPEKVKIEWKGEPMKYVSRGGYKLEKAVVEYGLSLSGLVCADVGASTGGFTDCMLQNGAAKVYAVVSHSLLTEKARTNLLNSPIEQLITTNSVPNTCHIEGKLKVLCVAPLLAEAIRRIHNGESVSTLFRDPEQ